MRASGGQGHLARHRPEGYIVPDYVHVLTDGRIVRSGGKELAVKLEEKGYGWIDNEVAGAAAGGVGDRSDGADSGSTGPLLRRV